jgi:DNA-binding NarL/FixJ family response regulator
MQDEWLYAARALRAGASGYLMKAEAFETLLLAVRQVLQGDLYLSPGLEKKLMKRVLSGSSCPLDPLDRLSDRELEVFGLIGQGKTSREIAKLLFLSVKTIESHRANLKEKLGLKKAIELVQQAIHFERESGGKPVPEADKQGDEGAQHQAL